MPRTPNSNDKFQLKYPTTQLNINNNQALKTTYSKTHNMFFAKPQLLTK